MALIYFDFILLLFFLDQIRINTLANLNTALSNRDEDELDQDLMVIRKVTTYLGTR
jgi:hypothetical protein